MKKGFIYAHRKVLENPFCRGNCEKLGFWIYLLLRANHKPMDIFEGNTKIHIKRGQFKTGRSQISQETGVSESSVQRWLKCLENEQQIEQQNCSKYRLISIVNYESHQWSEQAEEQQMNNKRTTDEQQLNTNNNINNINNENKEDKKNSSNQKADLEHFDFLWKQYPNKTGLKRSRSYYKNSVMSDLKRKEIEQALENYKSHLALPGNKFLKPQNGSTWFNNWGDWVSWLAPVAENPPQSAQRPLTNLEELAEWQRNRDKKKGQEEPLNG